MTCLARRHNDQMMCHHCGLVWDVNDPEPPTCLENRLPGYLRDNRLLSMTEAVDKYVSTDLDPDILLDTVRREVGHAVFDEYARWGCAKPISDNGRACCCSQTQIRKKYLGIYSTLS